MDDDPDLLEGYKGVVGFEVDVLDYFDRVPEVYAPMREISSGLSENGWAPQNAGNLSIRQMPHHTDFYITSSGSNFCNLRHEDVVLVHGIDVFIGEVALPIGGNYGIDGELLPSRIFDALEKQDLLKDFLIDFKLAPGTLKVSLEGGFEKIVRKYAEGRWRRPYFLPQVKRGRVLFEEMDLLDENGKLKGFSFSQFRHSLSQREFIDLDIARAYCDLSLNEVYEKDVREQNFILENHGFNLKNLLCNLNERGLIRCVVQTVGAKKPSSETLLHAVVYAARWGYDSVNAIVHCHAPNSTNNAPNFLPVTPTPQKEIGYGSLELAVEAAGTLNGGNCVVLNGHGPVVVSEKWQEWLPTKQEGCFRLNESFAPIFEDAFGILEEVEEQSRFGWIRRLFGI